MTVEIIVGDCREELRKLPAKSVQCVVTSPPYWGLRDYKLQPSIWGGDPDCKHRFGAKLPAQPGRGNKPGDVGTSGLTNPERQDRVARPSGAGRFCRCGAWRGCLGLEPTYQLYIEHIVEIFDEVWRVLRDDGVLWLNMGDCYANSRAGWSAQRYMDENRDDRTFRDKPFNTFTRGLGSKHERIVHQGPPEQPNRSAPQVGLKQKDKVMMPARVAIALQDAGWYLRQDNVWFKKNPMPESTGDRTTSAHEFMFHFSKSGDTLLWRHADGRWVYEKPEPEWRWRHKGTRDVIATEPPDWERRKKFKKYPWFRFNLWRGYDYYYDAYAIMEPASPDSHARAARQRSKTHKWANGGPSADTPAGPQSIAIGSPVAGRLVLPTPSGWDEGEGHHGSVHRDGRRPEVGIGHNLRPTKGAPNGAAHRGRGRPDGEGMERWNAPGPNSRVKVDHVPRARKADAHPGTYAGQDGPRPRSNEHWDTYVGSGDLVMSRNKRSVWPIATHPYKEAHFATFPPKLIEPCILAGCPRGGTVLDPFGGAGTTGLVANRHGRNAILIERNVKYAVMADKRIKADVLLMGPEQKKRHAIKVSGKLKPPKGPPLFTTKKAVTRDSAEESTA